ncbi:MAG: cupin domain-containing protein [Myxococcales bacterium]|nr:cupin domain-containing protein [Myxococcales bacterium]MCB9736927.1 cupin domain-containing protein [Deltaproteobacteria bacterium]
MASESEPARRHGNIVNIDEAPPMERGVGGNFGATFRRLGASAGARQLGCTYFEVPPGRSAVPMHWHTINEEAVFIVAGEGTMRVGDARVPVRAGDWASFPVGPGHAHRLENTGTEALRYLCISTTSQGEVCGYPDSKKIGAYAFSSVAGGGPGTETWARVMVREGQGVDYFDGEDIGEADPSDDLGAH